MSHRDFAAARQEHDDDPITFKLGGQVFGVRRRIPAGYLLDVSAVEQDPALLAVYLNAALLDDDTDENDESSAVRFDRLLHDPHALGKNKPVEIDLLSDIVAYVIEEQTGRPTKPPAHSPRGRSTSGPSSKASARTRSR
jgi:hypothetical protein